MHIDRQIRLAEQYNLKGLPGWRTKGAAVAIAEVLLLQCPNPLPSPSPSSSPPLFFAVVRPPSSIISVASSKCLQVRNSNFNDGTAVEMYVSTCSLCFPFLYILLVRSDCNGSTSQQWNRPYRNSGTTITLADTQVQFCLDAKTGECCQCFNEIS